MLPSPLWLTFKKESGIMNLVDKPEVRDLLSSPDLNRALSEALRDSEEVLNQRRQDRLDALIEARKMRVELRELERTPVVEKLMQLLSVGGQVLRICPDIKSIDESDLGEEMSQDREGLVLTGKGFEIDGVHATGFKCGGCFLPDRSYLYSRWSDYLPEHPDGRVKESANFFDWFAIRLGIIGAAKVLKTRPLARLIEEGLTVEKVVGSIAEHSLKIISK